MANQDAGGLLAAFIGAVVGFHYPQLIAAIIALIVAVWSAKAVSNYVHKFWNSRGRKIYERLDSMAASWYYRNRARFVMFFK